MVREDDLRATFEALHAQGTPRRPFEAADIIRKATRRRRTFAVVGSGLATAAAVVAAVLLPQAEPAPETIEPAQPQPTTTTSTTTSSTPLKTTKPTSPPQSSSETSSRPG